MALLAPDISPSANAVAGRRRAFEPWVGRKFVKLATPDRITTSSSICHPPGTDHHFRNKRAVVTPAARMRLAPQTYRKRSAHAPG